jgi:hypothetical protein
MKFTEEKLTVAQIVKGWGANELQRNDEYQRGETWSEAQKQALIDSILRGYPIPSLFLHSRVTMGMRGDTSEKFEVVDGQQRIIALADFMAGKFDLLDPRDKKLKVPNSMRSLPVSWAKRAYAMLSESDQATLRDRKLDVYIISEVEQEDQVRDLFIRLQSGTALTRQQIRDAWPGALGPLIEAIAGKMTRRPAIKVFGYVDGRGTRDDDNDSRDPFVKQRTTCAQVMHILLTRMNDPARVPGVGAVQLDSLYHEQTNLDLHGESVTILREVLGKCDDVCAQFDMKAWGKRKLPKVGLFCLAMFFQDIRKNPLIRFDARAMRKLAHYVTDGAPKTPAKTTEGGQIKNYYDEWRESMPKDIGIELDAKRTFSGDQQKTIWDRDGGICQVCETSVDAEDAEYDHYPVLFRDGGRTAIDNGRLVHRDCHPRGKLLYANPD